MKPEISVIIPQYKSIESLKILLETIPRDNRVEVIIVDDKSELSLIEIDKLKMVCKEKTNCLFLVNNTSIKGAGIARNIGLKQARGTWIAFADADDTFTKDAFTHLFRAIDECDSEVDMVCFPPDSLVIETQEKGHRHEFFADLCTHFYYRPTDKSECQLRCMFSAPWSKLYRKAMIKDNNIWFSSTIVANDQFFSTKAGLCANRVEVRLNTIYTISERVGSLDMSYDVFRFRERVRVFTAWHLFLRRNLDTKKLSYLSISGKRLIAQAVVVYGVGEAIRTFRYMQECGVRVFSVKYIRNDLEKLLSYRASVRLWRSVRRNGGRHEK